MQNKAEWELANNDDVQLTERLKVEGGFLYRTHSKSIIQPLYAMCFVPDVDLTRYQSHLRDAYQQGFKDGLEASKNGDIERSDIP